MIVPDGLSIGVDGGPRAGAGGRPGAVRRAAGRSIIVEDADRMTEQASNAVLKMIEEPPPRTVVMLCAPSLHPDDVPVTIRSRCRVVALRTPPVDAIADVLIRRDGVDPALAAWSAAASGGHVGRARRLARDEDARLARKAVLDVPLSLVSLAACLDAADDLVGAAKEETDDGDGGARRCRDRGGEGQPRRGRPRAGGGRGEPRGAGAAQGAGEAAEVPGHPARPRLAATARWSTWPASTATRWCSTRPAGEAAAAEPPRPPRRRRGAGPRGSVPRARCGGSTRSSPAGSALEQNVKPQIALEALTVALRLPA